MIYGTDSEQQVLLPIIEARPDGEAREQVPLHPVRDAVLDAVLNAVPNAVLDAVPNAVLDILPYTNATDLDREELARRRVLCQVGETFSVIWTAAFKHDAKNGISDVSERALSRLYGKPSTSWIGTCSHHPLVETTGRGQE